jgi:hypothetical protein
LPDNVWQGGRDTPPAPQGQGGSTGLAQARTDIACWGKGWL